MPGTKLSVDDPGVAIELNFEGEPTHIRVKPLYEAVKAAWEKFSLADVNPSYRQEKAPKKPIASTASELTASGNFVSTSSTPVVVTLTPKNK
jgi:hypothetical protein